MDKQFKVGDKVLVEGAKNQGTYEIFKIEGGMAFMLPTDTEKFGSETCCAPLRVLSLS